MIFLFKQNAFTCMKEHIHSAPILQYLVPCYCLAASLPFRLPLFFYSSFCSSFSSSFSSFFSSFFPPNSLKNRSLARSFTAFI